MKVSGAIAEKLENLIVPLLDDRGREINNPVPMTLKAGLTRPLSLRDQIRRVLKVELSQEALSQGNESFDEANDFEVKDDFETDSFMSKYELVEEEYMTERQEPVVSDPADSDPQDEKQDDNQNPTEDPPAQSEDNSAE